MGFQTARVRGSHHQMVHVVDHRRRATVPVHGNRVPHPKILGTIFRTARVSSQELTKAL
ncbi:MAG: type II toxin-antitoxin system HicA family toxin [Planctomycetes bacterium]|nr:type II toxin-antitoxin system HicA family toxin [Planctomycetota bacterium]